MQYAVETCRSNKCFKVDDFKLILNTGTLYTSAFVGV